MTVNKSVFFLALFVAGLGGLKALGETPSAVVKVRSFLCEKPGIERRGSGILFLNDDSVFALTSSDVIFHGDENDKVCHSLQYDLGEPTTAHLLAANFANGLALLKPRVAPPSMRRAALPFSAIEQGAVLLPGREGVLAGYSLDSPGPLRDEIARILGASNRPAALPLVKSLIEVSGRTDAGMTGGALLSPKGDLLGMVSHRYLKPRTGKPSEPKDYEPGPGRPSASGLVPDAGPVVGLVIPTDAIRKWLDQVFAQDPFASLKEDLNGQIEQKTVIPLGGIKFQSNLSRGNDGKPGAAKDPIITLSLDDSPSPQPWPFRDSVWLAEIKAQFLLGSTVVITGLEYEGKQYPVSDLVTTFSLIERGYRPLYRVIRSRPDDLRAIQAKLKNTAEEATRIVEAFQRAKPPAGGPADRLLKDLSELLGKLASGRYESVSDNALADLTEPIPKSTYDKGWSELYGASFIKACDLKSTLLRLASELKKIGG